MVEIFNYISDAFSAVCGWLVDIWTVDELVLPVMLMRTAFLAFGVWWLIGLFGVSRTKGGDE